MSSYKIFYKEKDGKLIFIYQIGYDPLVVDCKEQEILRWWKSYGFVFNQTEDTVDDTSEDYFYLERRVYKSDGLEVEALLAMIGDGGAITCTLDEKHRRLGVLFKLTFGGETKSPRLHV